MSNTVLTTLSGSHLRAMYDAGHWHTDTIYLATRREASRVPDRPAVRERAREITYRQLVAAADGLAARLAAAGLRPGDRVAVWLPSRIETAIAVLACSRDGYIACPSLHRDHTVGEVVDLVQRMRAAAVIAERDYGADADRVDLGEQLEGLASLRLTIVLPPAAETPLDALGGPATPEGSDPASIPGGTVHDDPDTVVYLAFTSGTTGEPKGVMHSDNTLLAPTRALRRDWALGDAMVVYSLSPLSHNLGFGAMVMAITTGGSLIVHDLTRGERLAQRLSATGTTFAFGVPTHAIDLLDELRHHPGEHPTALQGFRISGAPVPPSVAQGLLDHGIVPQSGYGMTEAGSHHYTRPDDPAELIVSSSGRPCAGHEARIVDRDDPERLLPPGEVGQIASRGASLMLGYFDDQERTESAFNRDGWFLTGDLGWVDEQGNIRITGRKKDLIIRGGHNIFPARIENLALQHPGIARAAVIPIADDRLGEKVCLAVAASGELDPDDVLRHLDRVGLSKYDMPEYFLAVDELPLMPSGKLDKRRLLAQVDDGTFAPAPIRYRADRHATDR